MINKYRGLFSKFLVVVLLLLAVTFGGKVHAADFETNYNVVYRLSQVGDGLNSSVNFNISIKNLRSDVYVDRFSISFPKSFSISNLRSSDDNGEISPTVESNGSKTKIEMKFNNPNIGKDSTNNFYLNFDQTNLFNVNGNVWEVILPVIENRGDSPYKVTVVLPEGDGTKKISIAKPVPDTIAGREIVWNNPKTRTIYAVFGNNQLYELNLTYNLKNTGLTPVSTEIALPPDSLYQKIYVNSLSQKPTKVYQDEDGNFLAVYNLLPRETKVIAADITVELFSQARDEVIPAIRNLFELQKKYLLNSQKFWEIKSLDKIQALQTPRDIYSYVTSTLNYSYERVTKDNVRLGAEKILQTPNVAVCMEFTDLFVAAAREKGIYAREIEGYGASSDPQLRPLSLSSDVLHAWPEFYDEERELWRPVDPTWENTSGIDYFDSFDLNHIVFAIHGKKSDYPLPAGMYKVENSKDIAATAVTDRPEDRKEIALQKMSLSDKISDKNEYVGRFFVTNSGSSYAWEIPVEIIGSSINVANGKTNILSLAPGESREITFKYRAGESKKNQPAGIKIYVAGDNLYESRLTIFPYALDIGLKIVGGLILITGAFLIVRRGRLR